MSEKDTNKEQWQEVYDLASAELKRIVKYCVIGWTLMCIGFVNVNVFILCLVGFFVIALPMTIKWFRGGGIQALFFWREYEVITTYSDGSKQSDGGMESFMFGTFFKLVMFVFVLFASCFLTMIKILYLIVKCFIANKKISDKSIFQSSVFGTIAVGAIVLIIFPIIATGLSYLPIPGNSNSTYIYPETHDGEVSTFKYNTYNSSWERPVYSKPNSIVGKEIFRLSKDQVITTTGKRTTNNWVEIESRGQKGWISSDPFRTSSEFSRVYEYE